MSKHTPGPWRLDIQRSPHSGEIIDCFVSAPDVNGFPYRAEVFGDDEYRDTDEAEGITRKLADFTLAAAAPDLLEALQGLLIVKSEHDDLICCAHPDCGCMGATLYQQAEHYARAAIAKARGEQP